MKNNQTITPAEIFAKQQVLTVEKARTLKGKQIATTAPEYHMNAARVNIFTVGDIITSWEEAVTRKYEGEGFDTVQDYWKSYMTEQQIEDQKNRLVLLSADGEVKHTAYADFGTFHGSDADRLVVYIECD